MDAMLNALRACAEPTRLRLLALAARGAFCVVEFTEILNQSQPRLSRHLRLLCDAKVLERVREGANVWFTVPPGPGLIHEILLHLPDDPVLEADRRGAARVLAERARIASESFRKAGAEWDETRALNLPADQVEAALDAALGDGPQGDGKLGRLLDIGTGTGRLLEVLAPRISQGLGVDASRAMLALARTRLNRAGMGHCSVRQADMYRLPLDGPYDVVVLQMVLHYAEDPAAAVLEAARVLAREGQLVVVDLAPHARADMTDRLAHRWPGFSDAQMQELLHQAGLVTTAPTCIAGPFEVRIWRAHAAVAPAILETTSMLEIMK